MPLDTHLPPADLLSINPVPGIFYGPCSGYDLPIVFQLCGDRINRFVFCDLGYGQRDTSAAGAVPHDWVMISRVVGQDEKQPIKTSSYSGSRLIRPSVVHEVWRRPDGTEAIVEMRRDLAEEALVQQFAKGSISVFLHHNDGTGEGGSNLWFLASAGSGDVQDQDGRPMLDMVVDRLADGAIVITDGCLTDSGFRYSRPFRSFGTDWVPLGIVDGNTRRNRTSLAWRANRIAAQAN